METIRVLVVDDVRINCFMLQDMLSDLDLLVDVALSGAEALAMLQKHEYALVLMDISMPSMNGFECVQKMQKFPSMQATPVIFLTAKDDASEFLAQGYRLGAVDYLIKPVDECLLIQKVEAFAKLYQNQRRLDSALEQARESRANSEQLLNHTAEGILGLDKTLHVTFANLSACNLLACDKSEIIGSSIKDIVYQNITEDQWIASSFYRIYAQGERSQVFEDTFWRKPDQPFPVQYTQASVYDGDKCVGGVLSFHDISERILRDQRIVSLAKYDQLTGLCNRTSYWEKLEASITAAKRSGEKAIVLFIDLDHFKDVNDRLGHDAGDTLLVSASERIVGSIRETDFACRMGGDEFAVVIPSAKKIEEGVVVGHKIVEVLGLPNIIKEQQLVVGSSIGVACFPDNGSSAEAVTRSADMAMYSAKRSGRNCVRLFDERLQKKVDEQIDIANHLRLAIARGELQFHYQLQVNLKTMAIAGMEALLRWRHPKRGYVSPDLFIPIAEQAGLIEALGEWTFTEASRQANIWHDQGLMTSGWSISVNASALHLKSPGFAKRFTELVRKQCSHRGLVDLELTETAVMDNPEVAVNELSEVRAAGVKVSIDDFGTGYSSLSYLKRLPLDVLKIDKSFVDDIGLDENDESIIRAIVQLAHSLDLKVIAEGIETPEQLEFLIKLGCDMGQGYYFSKPLNVEAATKLLFEMACTGREPNPVLPEYYNLR
ncbi:MAG: hypothetical protein COA42_18155 [Alteromonadaceae bacterium]|nr:MAG: hypothetical protein COA42_18155 [Alteromonadaceae bacterium]